jgi:hypothetical protein
LRYVENWFVLLVAATLLSLVGCKEESKGNDTAGEPDGGGEADFVADLPRPEESVPETLAETEPQPELLAIATVDDLAAEKDKFWNGSDGAGGFQSGDAVFNNTFNADWQSWSGWAWSTMTDVTTPGYENQYSAIAGEGEAGSLAYGIAYDATSFGDPPATVTLAKAGLRLAGMYVTNTTWAYLSMKNGDAVAKKFGGADGLDPDWFLVTMTGLDQEGAETGKVEFYLADLREEGTEKDYIIDSWTWVDLTPLGEAASAIRFSFSSSDVGQYGMNTPAYVAVDSIAGWVVTLDGE